MAPGFSGRDIALLGEILGEDVDEEDDDDDVEDYYVMGARRPRGLSRRRPSSRRISRKVSQKRREVARAITTAQPGQAEIGPRYIPLPFPAIQFVNAGALVIQTVARTQKRFKGVRLIIVEARSAATVVGLLTLTQFAVGTDPQSVALNPIPAGAFGPGAFQVDLALTPVEPGVDVTIQYTLSITPPIAETLDIATMILGLTMAT